MYILDLQIHSEHLDSNIPLEGTVIFSDGCVCRFGREAGHGIVWYFRTVSRTHKYGPTPGSVQALRNEALREYLGL